MDEVEIHLSDWAERGVLRVEPWVAVDQAADCVTPLAQLIMADAALARALMTVEDIDRFARTPMPQREWLRTKVDARSESPLETVARIRLRHAGFTVGCQVSIAGVGRVDLLVEGQVVVELDGRTYHEDPGAFANDRRRDRALQILGFQVARFTYSEVLSEDNVLESVVTALLRRSQRLSA